MSLPIWTTNPNTLLTLGNIETEFSGDAPTNFSEYYAGGPSGYVTSDRVGYPYGVETPIPSSGSLAISNFYGASSIPYTIITDKSTYNEGEVITFSITSPDFDDTVLYWTIENATVELTITPDDLPGIGINNPYPGQQLSVTGGVGPYFYTLAYGALPEGMSLRSNGFITGTPTSIGTTTFSVTATDSQFNSTVKEYFLTVSQVLISISPLTLPTAVINSPYSVILSASDGTAPY